MPDQFMSRKPRTTFAAYRWHKAEVLDFGEAHELRRHNSDDPAFVFPFEADKIEDFEGGVREAIAEWRRFNPNRNILEVGCTVLVEKAVFSRSAQAVANEVS